MGCSHAGNGRERCRRLLLLSAVLRFDSLTATSVEAPWKSGLVGTHYWDCNGAGCDATLLHPWNTAKFVFASQYAPTDPASFKKGARYGEKMWLIGAASDDLAQLLGPDTPCCGHDRRGQACGRCLLVRNPTAVNADWTAVVMKKSRCPPETKGCEKGNLHMDFAVPGLDNLEESRANVCGEYVREDTFITRAQSSVCSNWQAHGDSTITGCNCSLLPADTPEQKLLRQGCELFVAWGWTSGNPSLEWYEVECPREMEDRVKSSFGVQGVHPPKLAQWFWWSVAVIVVICCLVVYLLNRIFDHREKKKKKNRQGQQQRSTSYHSSDSSDSSSEISEMH